MRALIALLPALLAPLPAAAQTPTCRIDAGSLEFGSYHGLDPAPNTAIARVDIDCVPRSAVVILPQVTLSSGYSGQYDDRTMLSGTYELHYNLYADPARRLVLGDGSAGTTAFPRPRTRALGHASWAIFGVILPGQRVPAGIYADTLLIEVEF